MTRPYRQPYRQQVIDKKRMTKTQNRTAAFSLLVQCRDEALAALTPEKLLSSYGIPLTDGADMLATERARRDDRREAFHG